MSGPSGDKMIHVDMSNQTVEVKDFPDEWKLLGGRASPPRSWAPSAIPSAIRSARTTCW